LNWWDGKAATVGDPKKMSTGDVKRTPDLGSIIVIVATDAPLMPIS
jgi:L-aminopeptidase/D-esterase-like protein